MTTLADAAHIDIITPIFDENAEGTGAFFLDDAVIPFCIEVLTGKVRVHGLDHLPDAAVQTVWICGLDLGEHSVLDGHVDVSFTDTFTQAILVAVPDVNGDDYRGCGCPVVRGTTTLARAPCVVGYNYASRGQLLRVVNPQQAGAAQGPAFAKTRRTHQFAILLHNAGPVRIGENFTDMRPLEYQSPGLIDYATGVLFSGTVQATLEADYNFDNMIAWEITRPSPATVLTIAGFVQTQDR